MKEKLKTYLPIIVCIIILSSLIVLSQKNGQVTTTDSLIYYKGAQSISEGHGFVDYNNEKISIWPPAYPYALALFSKMGMTITMAGIAVNVFCYSAVLFLIWHWSFRILKSQLFAVTIAITIGLSFQLFRTFVSAHSESLFLTLILYTAYYLTSYNKTLDKKYLVLAAVLAILSWFTRYVGIYMVAFSGLFIILSGFKSQRPTKTIFHTIIYSLIVGLPFCLWTYRNLSATGSATGRIPASRAFGTNLYDFLAGISNSLLGDINRILHFSPIFLVLGVIFAVFVVYINIKSWSGHKQSYEKTSFFVLASISSFYAIMILLAASLYKVDALKNRLIVPFLLPAEFILCLVICQNIINTHKYRKSFNVILLAIILCMGFLRTGYGVTNRMKGYNLGSNSVSWNSYKYLRDYKAQLPDHLYSNNGQYASYILDKNVKELSSINDNTQNNDNPYTAIILFNADKKIIPIFNLNTKNHEKYFNKSRWKILVKQQKFTIYVLSN